MLARNRSEDKLDVDLIHPKSVICPVSLQIFFHPVTLFPSEIVIEQSAADAILSVNKLCPVTKQPITSYITAYSV